MRRSLVRLLSACAILFLTVSCDPSRTTAPRLSQSYDRARRCGGIARHWYNARDVPADGVSANELQIMRSGNLLWNGSPISVPTMQDYAARLASMQPPPQLALVIDAGTPCRVVDAVRRVFAAYCAGARCMEFSPDEWKRYSDRFVVYSPSEK